MMGGPLRAPQLLLLLWTLPGTPVLSYGDEVGLMDDDQGWLPGTPQPGQVWGRGGGGEGKHTFWGKKAMDLGCCGAEGGIWLLELCRRLAALRAQERSLSLGDAEAIPAGSAAAFLRIWDQSKRFLVVLNPGEQPMDEVTLRDPRLPPQATLQLSTHHPPPPEPHVDLGALKLRPFEGLLLSFPSPP
uniref:Uncharacterized protein n=1 Tax=Melopsittacus undulatus TaxID=13146 RepID=A0A8C6IRR6_MELUD